MTTQPEQSPLHHLLDRARRGALLPAEGDQLAGLVAELEADRDGEQHRLAFLDRTTLPGLHRRIEHDAETIHRWRGRAESAELRASNAEARVTELEAEVARLTAGQCVDSRRMCDLHHTVPVAGCPYPRCLATRDQTPPEHMPKGTNAEDCPACRVGPTPDYPWICPGPTTV